MRARNLKPSFFSNELLAAEDLHMAYLFSGLWCLADRDGKLEYRPKRIEALIFPLRKLLEPIEKLLERLGTLGFIIIYVVNDKKYILIDKFSKHQNPHKNERPSEMPWPENYINNQPVINNLVITRATRVITRATRAESLLLNPSSLNPKEENIHTGNSESQGGKTEETTAATLGSVVNEVIQVLEGSTASADSPPDTSEASLKSPLRKKKMVHTASTPLKPVDPVYIKFDHLSMTEKERDKLVESGRSIEDIEEMADRIRNYAGNKKYNSLYLTVRQWFKLEDERKAKDAPKAEPEFDWRAQAARESAKRQADLARWDEENKKYEEDERKKQETLNANH